MNKQQKEVQQAFLDNEKAVLKQLESNYEDALGEINSKIELLLARQDADMQHVIYQVEYQKALKTQVQSILENLQTNEFETISEYLTKSYEDGFIGTMYDLQGQGIPLIFPLDQKAVVDAIQNDTKLSESLYTKLGHDITDLKKKITGEISRGLSSGQMFSEISRNIASWARIPKNNAMRITRTEAHRIQCKATADAQHKAKEKGADVVKQWDSTLDSKTRESHVAMDGEIAELDDTFSNGLEYPGDPKGSAEEVINCRCALLQRARWALGNDYTKWSEDAPIVYSDDGTAQLAIIEAKNYKDFQEQYMQAGEGIKKEGTKKELLEKSLIDVGGEELPPRMNEFTEVEDYRKAKKEYADKHGEMKYPYMNNSELFSRSETSAINNREFDATIKQLNDKFPLLESYEGQKLVSADDIILVNYDRADMYLTDIQKSRMDVSNEANSQFWSNYQTGKKVIGYRAEYNSGTFADDLLIRQSKIDASERVERVLSNSAGGVAVHEYGHGISDWIWDAHTHGDSDAEKYYAWYKSLSKDEIKDGLSVYAATNRDEFEAECFAELITGDARPIAKKYGEYLEKISKGKLKFK